jgi:hypothetical protein
MWSIIFLIIFFLFFKQTSGFSVDNLHGGSKFFDLSEFNSFPANVKNALQTNLTAVMNAAGNKYTQDWNTLSAIDQQKYISKINMGASQIIDKINSSPKLMDNSSSPVSMIMSLSPAPAPVPQAASQVPMMASSSPVGMAASQVPMMAASSPVGMAASPVGAAYH